MRLTKRNRPSFTLIELLVVIAIIAVLSALAAGAYFATINSTMNSNTRTMMQALDKLFQTHWAAVIAEAKKDSVPASVVTWAGDPNRARVIWIKLRLWEAFPTTFREIQNPEANFWPYANGLIPTDRRYMAAYKTALNQMIAAGATPAADEAESSACLLIALSVNHNGARKLERDTLGAAYFFDANGDGVVEIVDGYKKAIRFFRFPTGSPDLWASNPYKTGKAVNFADPVDPDGYLAIWSGATRTTFENNVHAIGPSSGKAYYTVPVFVSAGKDQSFGLAYPDPSMVVNDTTTEPDNIYSYKIRQ